MFKLSKSVEYAILGLLYMAAKPDMVFSHVEEIAHANNIPRAYLAKLFKTLANKGLVKSFRGREGGFILTRSSGEITLLEVVEAIEGPIIERCLKNRFCPDDTVCPINSVLKECSSRVIDVLNGYSLDHLVERVSCYRKERK